MQHSGAGAGAGVDQLKHVEKRLAPAPSPAPHTPWLSNFKAVNAFKNHFAAATTATTSVGGGNGVRSAGVVL